VKQRTFDMGDLVLSWSPHTESSGKLESKWVGSYVVAENSRLGTYHLSTPKEECWGILGMRIIFVIFTFKRVVKKRRSREI
jgi:hypothetical protein